MAKLTVKQGDQELVVELADATVTMGRSSEHNTIALRDIKASRQHCQIEKTAQGWKLVDLESSNGTSVNGQKTNAAFLKHGDRIEVGAIVMTFEDPTAAPPAPVAASPNETVVPVLVSAPAAAPSPAARPSIEPPMHREPTPKKTNWVNLSIKVAACLAAVILLKLLYNNYEFEGAARDAYSAAVQLKQQGKTADAIDAYQKLLSDYPGTKVEASAKADLAAAQSALGRLDEANKAFEHAKLLTYGKGDATYLQGELAELAKQWADSPRAAEFQALIEKVKSDMSAQSDQAFASAKHDSDEAAAKGIYGDAIDSWKRFLVNFEGMSICEKVESEMSGILEKASTDWKQVVSQAGDLALAGKWADAKKVYEDNEGRFRGTRYFAEVSRKVRSLDAMAAGKSAAELAEADKKLSPHRADLDALLMRADELARSRRFKRAVETVDDLDKALAGLKDEALKAEYEPRGKDIRDVAALFDRLVRKINGEDNGLQNRKYELGKDVNGTIASATPDYMDVSFDSGYARVNWVNVPGAQLLDLLNRMAISAAEEYALGVVCYDNKLERDGNNALQKHVVQAKDDTARVFCCVARHRGMAVPGDGFIYFKEQWLTTDEHKYALLADKRDQIASRIKAFKDDEMMTAIGEMDQLLSDSTLRKDFVDSANKARVAALLEKKSAKIAAVKNLPAFKNFKALEDLKRQLNEARAEAMKTIFDLKIYPDENHGIIGQPVVDKKVKAVKDLWNKPLAVVAQFDSSVGDAINSVKKVDELLKKYNAPNVSATGEGAAAAAQGDDLDAILQVINEQLSLRNVCLDAKERGIAEYNKKVKAFNETVKTNITGDEREVIKLVNDYREMMGEKILEIEDHLVQAARDHSKDMEAKNYFAHQSLDGRGPGDRCAQAGYKSQAVGENIAMGMQTPQEAHLGWYNSSGHHRNMLSPGWNQMGCGRSGVYWTEDFGAGAGQAH